MLLLDLDPLPRSAGRIHLKDNCTYGRLVLKSLVSWPSLPIVVEYVQHPTPLLPRTRTISWPCSHAMIVSAPSAPPPQARSWKIGHNRGAIFGTGRSCSSVQRYNLKRACASQCLQVGLTPA